jgi:cathepsin A (carboxypeptidase C)
MGATALAAPDADVIKNLPDVDAFDTPTYSGYLKVSDSK